MTTREVQQALSNLGWPISVDGAYGPQTRGAVMEFQNGFGFWNLLVDGLAGPQTHHALPHSLANGGRCSEFFVFREFKSKGNGWIKVHRELARALDVYRRHYGPTRIVSGYRDPAHNQAVGGARNSQHLYGSAADLEPRGSLNAVRNLRRFSGIGVQRSSGLVRHVDLRGIAGPATTPGTPSSPTVWWYG